MGFPAKFAGHCANGHRFEVGATVEYDRTTKKITRCPACNGHVAAAPAPAADLGQGPAEPVQAQPPRKALPTPSAAEARQAFEALLARLDPEQRAVASWQPGQGSRRVSAAAGSGKTTTLVALVARLLWEGLLAASEVVVTTFTRKAADEITERLARVCPPGALLDGGLRVGTFHALALRALGKVGRSFEHGRNLDRGPRNAGVPSSAALWARVLDFAGIEGLPGTGAQGLGLEDADPRAYALAVDCARSIGSDPAAILAEVQRLEHTRRLPYLADAWRLYDASKQATGAWDFADALARWHAEGSDAARLVIVDEAQDNSSIQINQAQRLAERGSGEVIFVGDLRQSIYGWRGAAPSLFEKAHQTLAAGAMEIATNYRSASGIVALGNAVADGKAWCLGAPARAHRTEPGTITVAGYDDPMSEASAVASEVSIAIAGGARADDHAVLVRTNAAAAAFEAAFLQARIPVAVTGGTSFFGRREVLDALAYVTLATGDDAQAHDRVANRPKRFLGKVYNQRVAEAQGALLTRMDAVASRMPSRQASGVREYRATISDLRSATTLHEIIATVAGLLQPTDSDGDADADRTGLLPALVEIARRFEVKKADGTCDVAAGAQALLVFAARCRGEVAAVYEADEAPTGRVIVSTIHRAKGLEWLTVFVSATDGTFPHRKAMEDDERAEEEARLFYVAVTRAKDTLHLSYSDLDLFERDAGPSVFLDYVNHENAPVEPPEPPKDGGEPAPVLALPPAPAPAPAPAPTDEPQREALFDAHAFASALRLAEEATEAAPAPVSGRYVQPEIADFKALLAPLGFVELPGPPETEIIYNAVVAGSFEIRVYTTVPHDCDGLARAVGEDSIKVAAVWRDATGAVRPLHKKLPYAMRTRGWRVKVLEKVAEVAGIVADANAHHCAKCGAPAVERKTKDGRTFRGCVRYPDCK